MLTLTFLTPFLTFTDCENLNLDLNMNMNHNLNVNLKPEYYFNFAMYIKLNCSLSW